MTTSVYKYVSVTMSFNIAYTGFEADFAEELNAFVDDLMESDIQIALGALNAKLTIVMDMPAEQYRAGNGIQLADYALLFCQNNGIDLETQLESIKIEFCEDEIDE